MNIVVLTGRLAVDPVVRVNETYNIKTVSFSLAVQRPYVNKQTGVREADFIQCQMTGPIDGTRVDVLTKYFKKGDPISIEGEWRVTTRDQDGRREYFNTCVINRVMFVPINNRLQNNTNNAQQTVVNTQVNTQTPIQNTQVNVQGTRIVPGKKSSWQEAIPDNEQVNNNVNVKDPFVSAMPYQQPIQNTQPVIDNNDSVYGDTIPQAFDIGIDMSDEFLF